MKRLSTILGTTLAIWAAFAALGAAATLGLTSKSLAGGRASVSSCGVSSLAATRRVDSAGKITRVDVTGIPQACAGQTLSLTLKSQTGASLGGATAAIGTCSGGCTTTFTSFGAVSAATLYGYAFAVTG